MNSIRRANDKDEADPNPEDDPFVEIDVMVIELTETHLTVIQAGTEGKPAQFARREVGNEQELERHGIESREMTLYVRRHVAVLHDLDYWDA